jgi:hypothetical protein
MGIGRSGLDKGGDGVVGVKVGIGNLSISEREFTAFCRGGGSEVPEHEEAEGEEVNEENAGDNVEFENEGEEM